MPKRTEMCHLVPTKAYLHPGPNLAMLFAPCWCTHPLPPAPPFCSHRTYPTYSNKTQAN